MPTAQSNLNTTTSPNQVFFPAQSAPTDPLSERIELINALQQSLDIHDQLHTFCDWLKPRIPVDHLAYTHPDHDCSVTIGRREKHCTEYRLTTQNDHLGKLLFSRETPFGEQELAFLETYLSALLFPLRNGLQYLSAVKAAMTDPLTGLGNRAAMDNTLHRELRLAHRHRQALSLLVIDIDLFKSVNDSHGHQIGDNVLQHVAQTISDVTRDEDVCFRYGGEEFVMVLSNTDLDAAALVAERIRVAVANNAVVVEDKTINHTVSIGVSSLAADDKLTALFERADAALYSAKTAGRNQIAVAE